MDSKFWRNGFRTNLDKNPEHRRTDRNGRTWIKYPYAPNSNTLREGAILEHVQTTIPECNAVCLNKKRATSPVIGPHKDGRNSSSSWVMLWGDFENGGALCLEDGTRYEEKGVWHGPMDGANVTHWVEPHERGVRMSAVAFCGRAVPGAKKKRKP